MGSLCGLVLRAIRALPPFATGIVLASAAFLTLPWGESLTPHVGILLAVTHTMLRAAVGVLLFGILGSAPTSRQIVTVGCLIAVLKVDAGLLALIVSRGEDSHLAKPADRLVTALETLHAPDPSQAGALAVQTLFHGSGSDIRRREYGDGVHLTTPSVDASALLKVPGLREKFRRLCFMSTGPITASSTRFGEGKISAGRCPRC